MKLKKKEDIFFIKFREYSEKIVEACDVFTDLIHNYENVEEKVARMKEIETECDHYAHDILQELHGSFVTPFDREDIHDITREMDEIVDCMEEASNRFYTFHIDHMRPGAIQMVDKLKEAVDELNVMFDHLSEMAKTSVVIDQVIEVNRLEDEGDEIHREVLYHMFGTEEDPAELMKWYHLYQRIEGSLDACENVANIIQGVVMKYA